MYSNTCHCREPPEPTGDEAEDEDLEAPKIYEPVSVVVCQCHVTSCDPSDPIIFRVRGETEQLPAPI